MRVLRPMFPRVDAAKMVSMLEAPMLELSGGGKESRYSIVAVSDQGNGGYGIRRGVDGIVFIIRIIHTRDIGRIVDDLLLTSSSVYKTGNTLIGGIGWAVCHGTPRVGYLL